MRMWPPQMGHTSVYREAAVLIGQHLLGLETLQQSPPHKGAQDAFAQGGLRLSHGGVVDAAGGVKDDAQR